jgi:hypothetical protein
LAHVNSAISGTFLECCYQWYRRRPIMVVMMLMTANPNVTGTLRLPLRQRIVGWSSTAVMFLVAAGMIATWVN